jgi:hypothetical protein
VPKHVRVRFETQLGLPARPFDHAGEASGAERCASRNVSTILRQPSVEFKLGCLAFSAVD